MNIQTMLVADLTIDLESDMAQDFVLDTKKIDIPGYPHAFNASIIRWHGFLLLSFRIIPNPKLSFNSNIGLIHLDDTFNPIGKPQFLNMRTTTSNVPSRAEDARLIAVNDRLYIVYSDNREPKISKGGFRVYVAELQLQNGEFLMSTPECLSDFEGENVQVREKNWVPFNYNNTLLLAYSLTPHRIFHPLLNKTGKCQTIAETATDLLWDWGVPRGGTPALLINHKEYLSIFHSSNRIATIQSENKPITHYFMGAYIFAATPPFEILRISPQPIIGKNFYSKTPYKPYWKPVKAVFPCGLTFDSRYIWIAYGKDDHEIWIAKLDKEALLQSLVPLNPAPSKIHSD